MVDKNHQTRKRGGQRRTLNAVEMTFPMSRGLQRYATARSARSSAAYRSVKDWLGKGFPHIVTLIATS